MKSLYRTSLFFIVLITLPSFSADQAELNARGVKAAERGDYRAAVGFFIDALKLSPNDQTIARNLASACRALAAEYSNHGDMNNAVATLKQGLSYLPREPLIRKDLVAVLINQAAAFLKSKDYTSAQQASSEALQLDEENPMANCLAGDIAYALQDLTAARDRWQRALKSDPANKDIANRLNRLGKEQNAERNFSKMEAYHFDIRFDYQALGSGAYDIRKFLIEAYEKVGQDFDHFPEYPIVVILYKENEFRMVNNVPEHVAGLYDGKIRVPINYTRYPLSTLKGILTHEYTHAVIYDLAGPSCPIWLNEGMAMREMNELPPGFSNVLRRALKAEALLSFDQLGDPASAWRDPNRAPLAYSQSWIVADYLFSRWGNSQIKKLLLRIKRGDSFSAILQEDFNRTPAQFEEEWMAYAKGKLF